MAQVDDSPQSRFVTVADSVDARLFIELSSYASDLTEARHALELAIEGRGAPDSTLADTSPYLMGFAVVAYCRTFLHSNVRLPLTDHVCVPDALKDVHEHVRIFRNATIAHSQSELAVTYPLGRLDPRTLEVTDISAITVNNTLPLATAQRFHTLLETMIDQLDSIIEPVRARLAAELSRVDPAVLLARPRPTVLTKTADEFDPRSKRGPYPTGHVVYWDQVERDDE